MFDQSRGTSQGHIHVCQEFSQCGPTNCIAGSKMNCRFKNVCICIVEYRTSADVSLLPPTLSGPSAQPQHCQPMAAHKWTSCSALHRHRGARRLCECCRRCTAASCGLRPTPGALAASYSAGGAMHRSVSTRVDSATTKCEKCGDHELHISGPGWSRG
jgi:hypothetical protein